MNSLSVISDKTIVRAFIAKVTRRMVRKIRKTQEFIITVFIVKELINEDRSYLRIYVYYKDVYTQVMQRGNYIIRRSGRFENLRKVRGYIIR